MTENKKYTEIMKQLNYQPIGSVLLRLYGVIRRYVTIIKVKRNHSKKTGFFIVNVPEAKQYGLGFTMYIKGTVYGFSVHNNGL
jgi:hypothetical protein